MVSTRRGSDGPGGYRPVATALGTDWAGHSDLLSYLTNHLALATRKNGLGCRTPAINGWAKGKFFCQPNLAHGDGKSKAKGCALAWRTIDADMP